MIDDKFIANRITELRLKKGVSEYKMSSEMGHSSSYIHTIASGKSLPSMGEFLYMCEYFGITPKEFFDENLKDALLVQKLYQLALNLGEEDLLALINMAERLNSK